MVEKIVVPFIVTFTLIVIIFLLFNDLESFLSNLLNEANKRPVAYGFISFMVLTSDIVLPVPSSIVMYTNGYVLGIGGGLLISLAGALAGSIAGYYLGRLTSLGSKAKSDARAESILHKYGAIAILMSRGVPILAESVCLLCGYNKMSFRRYLIVNVVGYLPICALYAVCGNLGYDKDMFLLSFGLSLLLCACFWFLGRHYFKVLPNHKTNANG